MNKNQEYLINKIFFKLDKTKSRKISLSKDEFKKFISFLMKNS